MRIELHDERPPVPPERLAEVAARLEGIGHPIPPSYRGFLADQDGGVPVRSRFRFREGDREVGDLVHVFIGVEPSPDGDLEEHVGAYSGRIPRGTLPFADDVAGNVLLIDGRERPDGPVVLWDHERETDPPGDSNLYPVAPDFETFLAGLTEPPPPPAPERPTGWRRLFSRG